MTKTLPLLCLVALFSTTISAQVTQINSNESLQLVTPLTSTKSIFLSDKDNFLWVSEGDLASTIKLTTTIAGGNFGAVLNGKYIFSGNTLAHGLELFITDGTPGGTVLLKDINAAVLGSTPGDFMVHNGFVYFSAETALAGRELWRTDGTPDGTTMVKDINSGPLGSNTIGNYELSTLGSQLIFAANGNANGTELWKTDGTEAGTVPIKDLNPGANSSDPGFFWPLGNILLFKAKTNLNGNEVWRTDGTEAGTYMLKDINVGVGSSTMIEIIPGFGVPLTLGFHIFENKAFFIATDGTNNGNMYVTDGTTANTTLVKTLIAGAAFPNILLINAINLPGKFFFAVSDADTRAEIWQSNGTTGGTSIFKSFYLNDDGEFPLLFKHFENAFTGANDVLFQGSKFFFSAATVANGNELWISDGTDGGTTQVKNIGPGAASGLSVFSYLYTSTALFFVADNGTTGLELWKSDGTEGGTTIVQDINLNAADADPQLMIVNNGKVFFGATDGNNAETDLYVVNGTFTPLPATLGSFMVKQSGADAEVNWVTLTENKTSHFSIERSSDGSNFMPIGRVNAAGNSTSSKSYTYRDTKIAFPPDGKLYYRLATFDKDGSKSLSRIVVLSGKAQNWDVRILSNTPGAPVTLQMQGANQPVTIRLTDMSGKVVMTRKLDNAVSYLQMPMTGLAKGIYIVSIQHGTNTKSFRVIQ